MTPRACLGDVCSAFEWNEGDQDYRATFSVEQFSTGSNTLRLNFNVDNITEVYLGDDTATLDSPRSIVITINSADFNGGSVYFQAAGAEYEIFIQQG